MLLFLENNQKRCRSNVRLHIFLIQNGFHIDFQTFSAVVNNLACDNNLNFIADWYNWNCYRQKHFNRRDR